MSVIPLFPNGGPEPVGFVVTGAPAPRPEDCLAYDRENRGETVPNSDWAEWASYPGGNR